MGCLEGFHKIQQICHECTLSEGEVTVYIFGIVALVFVLLFAMYKGARNPVGVLGFCLKIYIDHSQMLIAAGLTKRAEISSCVANILHIASATMSADVLGPTCSMPD